MENNKKEASEIAKPKTLTPKGKRRSSSVLEALGEDHEEAPVTFSSVIKESDNVKEASRELTGHKSEEVKFEDIMSYGVDNAVTKSKTSSLGVAISIMEETSKAAKILKTSHKTLITNILLDWLLRNKDEIIREKKNLEKEAKRNGILGI